MTPRKDARSVPTRSPGRPADLPFTEHFQKMACGRRAKYIGARCRCLLCRAANSRYETERAAARRAGDHNGLVPAAAARAHLLKLSAAGVGRRAVMAACDVGDTTLQEIRSGAKTQIRHQTERRILSVDQDAAADHSVINGAKTRRQIAVLLREGFTKTELAARLGSRAKTPALQIGGRRRVIAKTAARVDRLYRQVMAGAMPGEPGRPRSTPSTSAAAPRETEHP